MKKKILAFTCLFMTLSLDAKIKHVLIDINLLIETSTSAASKEVGAWNSTKYLAQMGKIPNKTDFFKSLTNCPAQALQQTYNDDLAMPLILSDWLLGLQSNSTIKSTIFRYLDRCAISDIEKTIFKSISNMMLSPTIFIGTQLLRKDIVKVIHKLQKSGQYTIYIIGNWDKESEPYLIRMLQQQSICSTHNCIFSNKIKQLKPHADYYAALIAHGNLEPKECLVIDVEKKHVQGARAAGMASILVQGHNSSQLKNELSRNNMQF